MFNGFKVKHRKHEAPQLDPEVVGLVASLALKIIGQTVKGRALRAGLAAVVAGATAYLAPSQELSFSSVQEQASPPPEEAPARLRNECDASHLDLPRTALGR